MRSGAGLRKNDRKSQGIGSGSGRTLVVRFIGMKTVEAALRPVMNIMMEPESTSMDEVIAVAFGKQKRESFTGPAGALVGNLYPYVIVILR